jgi:hypothetical protein
MNKYMNYLRFITEFLTLDRIKGWLASVLGVFGWLWRTFWTLISVPIGILLVFTLLSFKSCQRYNQGVREAIAYQDSIITAQDTELWTLRADTLEAHFQIRELYNKLDNREKQEVLFYSQLRSADDTALQAGLDSIYGKHAQLSAGLPTRQPTQPDSFSAILSGGALTAPKFDPVSGWSTAGPARPLSGK